MSHELSVVIILTVLFVGMALIAGISYYSYLSRKDEIIHLRSKNRYYMDQYAGGRNKAYNSYFNLMHCVDRINELQSEDLVVLPSELEEIKNIIYTESQIMYNLSRG